MFAVVVSYVNLKAGFDKRSESLCEMELLQQNLKCTFVVRSESLYKKDS